jgi:hypothetical protein
MLYPDLLIPNATERITIDNKTVEIPKCILKFDKWEGQPIENTFGGKPLLDFEGNPVFAELLISHIFRNAGWDSRWVETYGKPKLFPIYLMNWKDTSYKNQLNHPIKSKKINQLLEEIAKTNNNTFGGCWDILAWKDDFVLFAESKRSKKDSIRSTQVNWINAGLKVGLKSTNFMMVEWEIK